MTMCSTCSAKFGAKFKKYTCARCQKPFCAGHLVLSDNASFHSEIMSTFSGGHGLCLDCILEVWGKTNEDLQHPKGILGRTKAQISSGWKSLTSFISRSPNRTELIKLNDNTFEKLNAARSLAVLRHQADISQDQIIADLTLFARVYAVSQGRSTEKSFALTDIYHLVEWLRDHPSIPTWAHGVTWSLIESSPAYLDYLSDIWHLAQTAVALSNPAGAAVSVAYHVGDRTLDQTTGKSLFSTGYGTLKDKLGLNVNVKAALISYFGGQFVMQLLKKR